MLHTCQHACIVGFHGAYVGQQHCFLVQVLPRCTLQAALSLLAALQIALLAGAHELRPASGAQQPYAC